MAKELKSRVWSSRRRRLVLLSLLVLAGTVVGSYAAFAGPPPPPAPAGNPPAPSIAASPSASPTNQNTIQFTLSDSQAGVTYQCSLDGSPFTACASPKGYGPLADGSHTFQAKAVAGAKMSPASSYTWTVDTTPPSVSSINLAGASPTNATSVSWTVKFSENVTGVATSDFSLPTTPSGINPITGPSITGLTGSGSTYTVTANTGTGDGTLGLNLSNKGSIRDTAGNALATSSFTGQVYTVRKTPPMISSITRVSASPTNLANVSWTVTFSEPVTGVNQANFALVNSGLTGVGLSGVTPAAGTLTTTWTVSANTGNNSAGTLGLNAVNNGSIKDAAGNQLTGNLTFAPGDNYQVDRVAPTLLSINRQAGAQNPTNTGPLLWTVTFNKPVTNVVAADFKIVGNSGGTAPTISNITPSSGFNTTYTVTVSTTGTTGTNNAQIGLNLTSAGTIQDSVGNALTTKTFTGQTYNYDTQKPPAPTITGKPTNPTTSTSATFTFCDDADNNGDTGCGDQNDLSAGTLWCSLNGATPTQCTSPVTYNNLSGSNTFCVYAKDLAGNQSATTCYSWTVSGGGEQALTLTGNATNKLYPGGPAVDLNVTLTNPNGDPITVTSLTVTLTGSLPSGCLSSYFPITQSNVSATHPITVPAHGSVTLPDATNAPGVTDPTVSMSDNITPQNVCAGAVVNFNYASS